MSELPRVFYLDHTSKWSGGEIALFRTLTSLDRGKVDPVLLLATEGEFVVRLRAASLETVIVPLDERLRKARKETLGIGFRRDMGMAMACLRYALRLVPILRRRRADLIHCNSLKSDIYGALAGKIAGIPVLWHIRDHIDPSYLPRRVVTVFRRLARSIPSGVLTNSLSTENKIFPLGAGRQRCRVVYDGLMDSELQTPCPLSFDHWNRSLPQIGLLGRIVPWKGQHIFLEAAKKLTDRGIKAHFQVIGAPLFGEAAYEAQLRQQAVSLGDRVSFLGFRSDVSELLRGLDILAHCSITPEPFGQVVIEGMAEGLPVVASDGGGVQEIIEQGVNGLRTPMGDASALADALERLLMHPEEASALGQAAYKRVREKFTAAHSARAIESFYRELLGRE
ncbi:glycosyltransferase family 4 protein [Armatimonas sp.]|uniref:glycosyltransferase family 4 protein n=1 Tax=Armatimonas sp. TaxID=1872638 RepID=UPI003752C830